MTCLHTVPLITHHTFLQPTAWCTIRPQKEGYVFYNARTDELHLISETGFAIYQRCNGLYSVGEITEDLGGSDAQLTPSSAESLHSFLEQLLVRGIVEVSHDLQP